MIAEVLLPMGAVVNGGTYSDTIPLDAIESVSLESALPPHVDVYPLAGALSVSEQDHALQPSPATPRTTHTLPSEVEAAVRVRSAVLPGAPWRSRGAASRGHRMNEL